MNPPIVTVTSVSKTFKLGRERVHALKNMSLSIDQGEVFALLGPNGSGKTTTLNILSGLLDPDHGSVKILGRSPGDRDYFKGVSFMSGDAEYFWAFTVSEILKFYGRLTNVAWKTVLDLVEEFGIQNHLKRTWMMLSNGEKTRVRLVQALLSAPQILFLDEPTVGLDADISDLVRTKLRLGKSIFPNNLNQLSNFSSILL